MQIEELYSGNGNIEQCFWVYNGSHIVFSESDTIFLLEIEPQGKQHVEQIAKIRKGTSFFYSSHDGYVYFIDAKTFELNAIKVIPEDNFTFAASGMGKNKE